MEIWRWLRRRVCRSMISRCCSKCRGRRRHHSSQGLDQAAPLENGPAGELAGEVQAIVHGPAKNRHGTLDIAEKHGVGRRIPEKLKTSGDVEQQAAAASTSNAGLVHAHTRVLHHKCSAKQYEAWSKPQRGPGRWPLPHRTAASAAGRSGLFMFLPNAFAAIYGAISKSLNDSIRQGLWPALVSGPHRPPDTAIAAWDQRGCSFKKL